MRHTVIVRLSGGDEIELHTDDPLGTQEARAWLDEEYVRLECVPGRASGKVLNADKLLSVAREAGAPGFADAAWAAAYARAAAGALGKPLVRVDVDTASVGF